MKLSGWYRVGIVVSVFWCFLVIGVTIYDYNKTNSGFFISVIEDTSKIEKLKDYEGTRFELVPLIPIVNYKTLLLFLTISLVTGWIFVLSIIFTIKWVLRGFKKKYHNTNLI